MHDKDVVDLSIKFPYKSGLFTSAFLLAACAVGPDFHTPATPCVKNYTPTPIPSKTVSTPAAGKAGKPQYFVFGKDIPQAWWQLYHSPTLTSLIQKGMDNSPTLAKAKATLRQAEETLTAQIGTSFYPAVTAQVSGQRTNFNLAPFGDAPATSSTFNVYNTGVNLSYALDVFGAARRQVESVRAQVNYQQYEVAAAQLTLAANIVTTAIMRASLEAQIDATKNLIQEEEQQLSLMQQQLQLGGVSGTDVLTKTTQVAKTRARLPPLEKELAQAYDALSVLIGELPGARALPALSLDELTLPACLPLSLPSHLVQQRPDVRAAEALLHQATAQVGLATANLFPQFAITGAYGWSSNSTQPLIAPDLLNWNYMAQLTQPLFNGGALRAQRRAALAALDAAYAQYRQTVLNAFQNVADALRAIETDARAVQAEQLAETAAHDTLRIIQKQFKLGGVDFLTVLTAEQQYQETRIRLLQAKSARYADTAALFQALGGGTWQRCRDVPTAPRSKPCKIKTP